MTFSASGSMVRLGSQMVKHVFVSNYQFCTETPATEICEKYLQILSTMPQRNIQYVAKITSHLHVTLHSSEVTCWARVADSCFLFNLTYLGRPPPVPSRPT
jgi:hypothetical protein